MAKAKQLNKHFEIRQEDIRKTSFKDNQFDLIISIAAFEHIPNLDQALTEMHRILKSGSLIYTKFGPTWSGAWGHHLWTQNNNNPCTYFNTFLPPYCHPLITEDELFEHGVKAMQIPGDDAEVICNFVSFTTKTRTDYFSVIMNE